MRFDKSDFSCVGEIGMLDFGPTSLVATRGPVLDRRTRPFRFIGRRLLMDVRWILGGSVLLQVAAAILALRLIKITGRRVAWVLIASAIALMTVRRAFSLYSLISGNASVAHNVEAELIALAISILMLMGVALIAPMFRAMQRSELALRDARDTLEEHVRERTDELTRANESLAQQIARRAKVESELRTSEERFRTVNETIAAAVFIYRGTNLIEVNPAACAMTGYSRDELLKMHFWDVLHPDFQNLAKKRGFARQAGVDVPNSYEVKLRCKSGEDRWITFSAGLIDYQGEPATIGTAYDVSRLKRVEHALREADAHQRLILQTVPMAIYTAEPSNGQFVVWMSEQVQQITGFPPDRFLQRDGFWASRVHPDDAELVLGFFERLPETEVAVFEYRWLCANGEYRWFLEHPTFLRDEKGEPSEIIGTWLDINERKLAEEALVQSEQRIQAIINNTTAVVYMKDVNGKYLLINRRYAELFDVDYEHAIGKTDYDFHPAPVADAFRENDRNVLKRNKPTEFEEVAPHIDGDHIYLSLKFPIYDANGIQSGICGISTDITERKQFEADLREAKEEAEAANIAKSRFLANISHEIRTPITAMLGAAEQMQSADLEEQTRLRRSDMILRNGRHLLALVNDLLDVSRLEAGKLHIRRANCSLLEILTDVIAITRMSDVPADLEFKVLFETDIPETIHTDRTRLTQAIANIVSNARKFTTRGHVHVRVAVSKTGDEPRLTIAVEDTGPGIADADRQHIFDVFTQGHAPPQRLLTGAGVGLSLSKWIAEQLGGSLILQSTSSEGSVFVLSVATGDSRGATWIDREEAAQRLDEGMPLVARELPELRGRVLLAEDVEDTRTLIEKTLTSAGATVVTAVDGAEAVDRCFEGGTFDLILLDIRMPKMDGFAAGHAIREGGYRSAMIALTASTTAAERDRVLAAGFDDVWMKPISLDRLILRVSAFLDTATTVAETACTEKSKDERGDILAELSQQFLGLLPERVRAIEDAVERGDCATYRELLHQLIGSAGIHGFMRVSQEAASLMRTHADSGKPPQAPDIARLVAFCEAAQRSRGTGETSHTHHEKNL
jgi:PAS domain S-box-containing protein